MKALVGCCCLFLFIYGCVAPPVNEKKKKDKEGPETNEIDQQVYF
jgi:hypothetical protein